jgi:hypothetical protein
VKQHWPSVFGCPVCYIESDHVKTRDGREGTVLGYSWDHDLVIYQDGIPSKGFFIVTVDLGDHTEKFLRHELSGTRFGRGGSW